MAANKYLSWTCEREDLYYKRYRKKLIFINNRKSKSLDISLYFFKQTKLLYISNQDANS